MTRTIDVVLLVRLVLKKWYLFVITGAVSLAAGLVMTSEVKPNVYQAYTSISSLAAGSYKDSTEGAKILQTYAELVYSGKIAAAAKSYLPAGISAAQIQSMVSTDFSVDSSIFYITSSSGDPQTAVSVANAVAEAFVAELGNITGGDTIKVYDRAVSASITYNGKSEQRKMRMAIPAVSVFLAVLAAAVWAIFSGRIRSVSEAELGGSVTVIGVIPRS